MPWYKVRGRLDGGAARIERFEAASAAAALERAREAGLAELELLSDDLEAGIGQLFPAADTARVRAAMTAEEEARTERGGRSTVLMVLRKAGPILALAALWIAGRRWLAAPFGWVEGFSWLVIALVAVVAVLVYRSAVPYNRMLAALVAGRYPETLARCAKLEGRIPRYELAFRRAGALLGLGRRDEADAEMRTIDADEAVPRWMADLRWCDYHQLLLDLDGARAAIDRAIAANPDTAIVWIAAAELESGPMARDATRAAERLERAQALPRVDNLRWGVEKVEGLIRLGRGDPRGAIPHLEAARKGLADLPYNALIPGGDASIAVELARARIAIGERATVAAELDRAERWLIHHPVGRLLLDQARAELAAAG